MSGALARLDARIAAYLDRLAARQALAAGLIALLAAVFLVPGQATLPITDRDEARYVLASKQMLETGDFVEPRNLDQPRWKKPVGIYWLQAGAAAATGHGADAPEWVWRLPSSLGIAAAALLTLWALTPLVGAGPAAVAGLVVAASVVTAFEGHIAKTDAALLAVIVLAQGALIRALERVPEAGFAWPHALFWAALAAGTLIKGPIVVIVAGGTLLWLVAVELSFDALRRTRPWPGLLLFAALTLPWFALIGIRTDWAFYAEAVGRDLLGKVDGAAEGHTGPPGYYLMTVWVTFWPWTPLALLALPAAWAARRSEAMRFLAGWIIPTWLVFAVATTKLPHYVMPALPAVGGVIGYWLFAGHERARPVLRLVAALAFVLGGAALAAVAVGGPLWMTGEVVVSAAVLSGIGVFLTLIGALALGRGLPRAAAVLGVAAAALLIPAVIREALPRIEPLWMSERMAALDARFDACAPYPVVGSGYGELSLAILAGTDTRFGDTATALAALRDTAPGARAFIPASEAEAVAADLGGAVHVLGRVEGINYNRGPDPVALVLLSARDDPALAACLIP